jgi:transposase
MRESVSPAQDERRKPEATRFATDLDVPFTNNAAESASRMTTIHAQVSGCFQGEAGAHGFAAIRSDLATAAKHDIGALDVLAQLFGGEAWIPPRTT